VLSFKGLSFNLGYGIIGLLYSVLLAVLRDNILESRPFLTADSIKAQVFIDSIAWFPWYYLLSVAVFVVFARERLRNSSEHKTTG
jgi:hypothetical protein